MRVAGADATDPLAFARFVGEAASRLPPDQREALLAEIDPWLEGECKGIEIVMESQGPVSFISPALLDLLRKHGL